MLIHFLRPKSVAHTHLLRPEYRLLIQFLRPKSKIIIQFLMAKCNSRDIILQNIYLMERYARVNNTALVAAIAAF